MADEMIWEQTRKFGRWVPNSLPTFSLMLQSDQFWMLIESFVTLVMKRKDGI